MRRTVTLLIICAGLLIGGGRLWAQGTTPPAPAAPPPAALPSATPLPAAPSPAPPGGDVPGLLYHVHHAAGIPCAACHTETPPSRPAAASTCLTCHGPLPALVARTAGDEPNPHATAHIGPLACTDCHHVHTPSQSFCNQCHSFDMTVP